MAADGNMMKDRCSRARGVVVNRRNLYWSRNKILDRAKKGRTDAAAAVSSGWQVGVGFVVLGAPILFRICVLP